jgi:sporulation protein YqfD
VNIWKSLSGVIDVRLTSADIPAALKVLVNSGVNCFDMRDVDGLTVEFSVIAYDYPVVISALDESIADVCILRKRGVRWKILRLFRRPVLVGGVLLVFVLTLWLPTRVLFVSVEGNKLIPEKQILEQARRCGIAFGADRKTVRSEKVKNYLLDAVPGLQWAGINTHGCVAVISVLERTKQPDIKSDVNVGSIVARCDGVIKQLTVYSGNPVCKEGQAVVKGQLLVSGYTDCGILIKATRAEAEIVAETSRELTMVSVYPAFFRDRYIRTERNYSVFLGKKLIKLHKGSGILGSECVRIQEVYHILLPGGFALPVGLIEDRYEFYASNSVAGDGVIDQDWMRHLSEDYLKGQMVAGMIISVDDNFLRKKSSCVLTSKYICQEMIGKLCHEEKLYKYGTSN